MSVSEHPNLVFFSSVEAHDGIIDETSAITALLSSKVEGSYSICGELFLRHYICSLHLNESLA